MQQNKNILQNATTGQPITSIAESLAANLDFIKINVVLKKLKSKIYLFLIYMHSFLITYSICIFFFFNYCEICQDALLYSCS